MIYNKYVENIFGDKMASNLNFFNKFFNIKNIVFVLVAVLMSMQSFLSGIYPFGFALLAVASVFNVPLIIVVIPAVISMAIGGVSSTMILQLLVCFVLFTLITALINIEGISKKYVVLIKLMISIAFTQIAVLIFGSGTSDLFTSICTIMLVASFYMIFVSGIHVILNLGKEFVFSKEENLAAITVLVIALGILKNVQIFNFSIFCTLGIAIILLYGWKNSSLSGATAGLIIGLILSIMGVVEPMYIITLAFAGFIAGLCNKLGKLGVLIGFIFGSFIINYWLDGVVSITNNLVESIAASIVILVIPKKLEARLDKLFNKNLTIKSAYSNLLGYDESIKSKLDAMSDIFGNLADITIPLTEEDSLENRQVIKRYIVDYVENKCIECGKSENCIEKSKIDELVEYIASKLEKDQYINSFELDFECDNDEQMLKDINEIYNSMKLMRIIKQKEKENNLKLANQYKEVSKIISSVASNIKAPSLVKSKEQKLLKEELQLNGYVVYEDNLNQNDKNVEYIFITDIFTDIDKQKKEVIDIVSEVLNQNMIVKLILNISKTEKTKIKLISKPKYEIETSILSYSKDFKEVSGDSYISMELEDSQHLIALSDGAGSGNQASKSSKMVINMLEKLLNGGFEKSKAIEIINSVLKMKKDENHYATLDTAIIDLRSAQVQFLKIGAAPTYIIESGNVCTISTCNIPVGIISDAEYVPIMKKIKSGSIIIQVSDGVIPDNMTSNDNYFTKYLENIDTGKNINNIADELYKIILKENNNELADDTTLIVSKVIDT